MAIEVSNGSRTRGASGFSYVTNIGDISIINRADNYQEKGVSFIDFHPIDYFETGDRPPDVPLTMNEQVPSPE